MVAEAGIFCGARARDAAAAFPYHRKRGGQLFSKMRFVSAQLDALLTDGLWLAHARHANAQAARLAAALGTLPGVEIQHTVQANEIFLRLAAPRKIERGSGMERWGQLG